MLQIAYGVAAMIGLLAISMPFMQHWPDETLKTSVGFGIGVLAATIYAVVRGVPASARLGASGAFAGATVRLAGAEWYDEVVLLACVLGGFLSGMAA